MGSRIPGCKCAVTSKVRQVAGNSLLAVATPGRVELHEPLARGGARRRLGQVLKGVVGQGLHTGGHGRRDNDPDPQQQQGQGNGR